MSFYKQQLKDYLAKIDLPAGKILCIGAQSDDKKYFKSVCPGEWKTLDIDDKFKPDILFNMNRSGFDPEAGDRLYQFEEYFDHVLAFELWEYIYDPVEAHKNIYSFLKPGGVYMGSYPFVYGKHPPNGQDFLRYTDDGIKKILNICGFKDIEIRERATDSNTLLAFYAREGMRIRNDCGHEVVGYIVKAKK